MNGLFLTLEGGEGCGTSTQLERVAEALRAATGREVVTARSPGGTAVAEKIRAMLKRREPGEDLLPETELMLFGACHAQMCEHPREYRVSKRSWECSQAGPSWPSRA